MKYVSCLFAIASLGLSAGSLAEAAPAFSKTSETVRFADLNIDKDTDAAILYHRIRRAAAHVCGRFDSSTLFMHQVYENCQRGAIDAAVEKVGRASVSRYAQIQKNVRNRIRLAESARF